MTRDRRPQVWQLVSLSSPGGIAAFAVALCLGTASPPTLLAQGGQAGDHWVGTWATAVVSRSQAILPPAPPPGQPAPAAGAAPTPGPAPANFNNQTVRQIVHTSIGGPRVRVVLSNAFGSAPLTIGAAHVALRDSGAAIVPSSDRTLTFGGNPSVTIPPGASVLSDPAVLTVAALVDLAIDLYLPGDTTAALPLTAHNGAWQTNYVSPTGNHAGAAALPVMTTAPSWFLLARVEVMAPASVGALVALGDSITDGTRSTPDTNRRWPDFLAKRLLAADSPVKMGVLNLGIAGNRVLGNAIPTPAYNAGVSALARFDRDALTQTGATHVIVLEGINDIRGFAGIGAPRQYLPSAEEMIGGYRQLIERAHALGLKIYGATLTPYGGAAGWSADDEAKRQAVNQWIRTGNGFDAVIDFDAAVRDPNEPTKLHAAFDSSDHLHPSDAGYQAMANAIDLTLLQR